MSLVFVSDNKDTFTFPLILSVERLKLLRLELNLCARIVLFKLFRYRKLHTFLKCLFSVWTTCTLLWCVVQGFSIAAAPLKRLSIPQFQIVWLNALLHQNGNIFSVESVKINCTLAEHFKFKCSLLAYCHIK